MKLRPEPVGLLQSSVGLNVKPDRNIVGNRLFIYISVSNLIIFSSLMSDRDKYWHIIEVLRNSFVSLFVNLTAVSVQHKMISVTSDFVLSQGFVINHIY